MDHNPTEVQIHGLCDASEWAYAAVMYIQCSYQDHYLDTRLVTSKTRVAPIKKQTIPRLELLGALILARLMNTVVQLLDKSCEVYCWTDSTTVLQWIKNKQVYKQYIQNRIDEIRQLTCQYSWRHCPGELNPADLPSRGIGASELVKAQLWWKGPGFLTNQEDKWPMTNLNGFSVQARTEILRGQNPICHSLFVTETSRQTQLDISRVIEVKNFSGFSHLLRITAYVLRFVKHLKTCIGEPSVTEEFNNSLRANEIESAELVWIRSV